MADTTTGTDHDSYSPLLAKMLRLDPESAGNISLSALGKAALGTDTEDYQAAKKEVDDARIAMLEALSARKSGVDESMLALSAGFLAPTRTGSFGESLGSAVKGYGEAQRQQSQEATDLAKMRYELARGTMQERASEAKLGLDVAGKLTPKLTEIQNQVRAEGIDPSSEAGRARVRELQSVKEATPDMKEFAARAGLSITDPAFSTKYAAHLRNKPLTDIALREGLNLEDPAEFARAQSILRADKLRASKPEIAKVLETFGGDILNPDDVKKAESMLKTKSARDVQPEIAKALDSFGGSFDNPADLKRAQQMVTVSRLKQDQPGLLAKLETFGGSIENPADVKRAQKMLADQERQEADQRQAAIAASRAATASSNAQVDQIRQQIAEGKRSGNVDAVAQAAASAGVPLAASNRYANMTPREEAAARERDKKSAEDYLQKNVTPFVSTIDSDILNLQRALSLNSRISTGYTYGMGYGVGDVAKSLSGDRALINEFDSLAALAAKQNRIPGDSNVSNLDVKMMSLGTFSSDKEPSTNKTIIEFQLAQRERDRDFNSFLSNYAAVNGSIDSSAMTQWRRYLDANPITTRDSRSRIVINKDRMPYQEFFRAPRVRVDANGREQQGQKQ